MRLLILVETRCLRFALVSLAFLLVAAECGLAQNLTDFPGLQKHVNKDVTVETQDGPVSGKLLRVEENRLVVYDAGAPKAIARESVRRVIRHHSRHTAAWMVGMAGAGASLGFLIGMGQFDDSINASGKIGVLAGVWAGGGAAAGYGFSRIGKHDEVVYHPERQVEDSRLSGDDADSGRLVFAPR
jgi:hypothetical protein